MKAKEVRLNKFPVALLNTVHWPNTLPSQRQSCPKLIEKQQIKN